MISRNLKRFAASNGTAALVLTCMILGSGFTASAQTEGARPPRDVARAGDDPRLSHGRGPEDLASAVCLRYDLIRRSSDASRPVALVHP